MISNDPLLACVSEEWRSGLRACWHVIESRQTIWQEASECHTWSLCFPIPLSPTHSRPGSSIPTVRRITITSSSITAASTWAFSCFLAGQLIFKSQSWFSTCEWLFFVVLLFCCFFFYWPLATNRVSLRYNLFRIRKICNMYKSNKAPACPSLHPSD